MTKWMTELAFDGEQRGRFQLTSPEKSDTKWKLQREGDRKNWLNRHHACNSVEDANKVKLVFKWESVHVLCKLLLSPSLPRSQLIISLSSLPLFLSLPSPNPPHPPLPHMYIYHLIISLTFSSRVTSINANSGIRGKLICKHTAAALTRSCTHPDFTADKWRWTSKQKSWLDESLHSVSNLHSTQTS